MLAREFARRAFSDALEPTAIEQEVEQRWDSGAFLFHLGPSAVPPLGAVECVDGRYSSVDGLTTGLLFGSEGHSGCLVITTPACPDLDESLRRLLVPAHTHGSPHAALVLDGEARFLVARQTRAGPVLIDEAVSRGALIFCSADAPHTFVTRRGFRVASLHARYVGHHRDTFANRDWQDFASLPRCSYDEFRREWVPTPGADAASPG